MTLDQRHHTAPIRSGATRVSWDRLTQALSERRPPLREASWQAGQLSQAIGQDLTDLDGYLQAIAREINRTYDRLIFNPSGPDYLAEA